MSNDLWLVAISSAATLVVALSSAALTELFAIRRSSREWKRGRSDELFREKRVAYLNLMKGLSAARLDLSRVYLARKVGGPKVDPEFALDGINGLPDVVQAATWLLDERGIQLSEEVNTTLMQPMLLLTVASADDQAFATAIEVAQAKISEFYVYLRQEVRKEIE